MAIGNKAQVRQQNAAAKQAQAAKKPAQAQRQQTIEQSAGMNSTVAAPKTSVSTSQAVSSPSFAPGTRPDVVTQSKGAVFVNGKMMVNFGYGPEAEQKARQRAEEWLRPGRGGRIDAIRGDSGGETFRALNLKDKGTQTGRANVTDAAKSVQSKGMNTVRDENGNVVGSETKAETQRRTFSPVYDPTSKKPVERDVAREEEARARIAEERGIDLENATAGQRMLLNENVNLDVYGEARPNFSQQQPTAQPATQRQELPDYLTDSGDSDVVTADSAEKYLEETLPMIDTGFQENSESVTGALNSLAATDPDVLAAEQSGEDMQTLLEQRRAYYEEQYEQLRSQIQDIYDSKEDDYRDQAAQVMGQSIAQLAAIGALGVTSAGAQYIDSVSRANEAKIAALATEEAAALNSAYSSYMEADFGVATEMINNAREVRKEIRTIKAEQLQRQKTLMELKQMEREDASQTIETMVASGMDIDDLPNGYLDYLDQKAGYAPGTSAGLWSVAQKEKTQLDAKTEIEQANAFLDVISSMQVGGPPITIGGTEYSLLDYGNSVIGTESGSDGQYLWSKNLSTGETSVRKIGTATKMAYDDFKTDDGVVVRRYEDGSEVIVHDPSQWDGGLSTGGIIDKYPDGTDFGQCGRFVNELMGTSVGNSDDSKMAITDPSITAENARIGDIFVQDESKVGVWTGHIGIINSRFIKNGEVYFKVSEANWGKDEKVTHYREVPASKISGYARGSFVNPGDQFNAPDGSDDTITSSYVQDYIRGAPLSSIPADVRDDVVAGAAKLRSDYSRAPSLKGLKNITGLTAADKASFEGNIIAALEAGDNTQVQSLVKNAVRGGQNAAMQERIDGRDDVISSLESIQSDLDAYYASGGETGIFAGTEEQIAKKVGKISDPTRRAIAQRIQLTLVNFRKSVSGAAFTTQEAAEYEALFPNIKNGKELNDAVIDSLITTFKSADRNFYSDRLGGEENYNAIFGTENSNQTIRVRVKATGETGTIPADEFDSSIYDRV